MPFSYDAENRYYEYESALAPYMVALGFLCKEWAELERCGREATMRLQDMAFTEFDYAVMDVYDFRDVLRAGQLAAVAKVDDKRWIECFLSTSRYIDNVIRPLRNRYVHDQWIFDVAQNIRRINRTPKIVKPQAFKLAWEKGEVIDEPLDNLWLVAAEAKTHGNFLNNLTGSYTKHPTFPMSEMPSRQPPQRLPLGLVEKQDRPGSVGSAPERQIESSPQ